MIRSFRSKALQALWLRSDASKLPPHLRVRIERGLDALDLATLPEEMNIPGFIFHRLTGDRAGTCTVHVNDPWCITFRWDGLDAIDVNLENYH